MTSNLLYYYPRSDINCWNFEPPGRLSVKRFISSQPYWQQERRVELQRKRTLVLCDWAFSGYTPTESSKCLNALEKLLQEGFVLYAWQKDKLVLLDLATLSKNLSDYDFRKKLAATDKKQIEDALASKEVAQDEIGILDYFALKSLVFGENEPRLDSHHVNRAQCELDVICAQLSQISLANAKAVHTQFDKREKRRFEDLLQKMPHNKTEEQLKTATIWTDEEVKLFLNRYYPHDLEFLEEFECNKITFLPMVFEELLVNIQNARKIRLASCKTPVDELKSSFLATLDLSRLQSLDCTGSSVSTKLLGQLLSKAPNVEFISLTFCENLSGKFEESLLATLNLSHLQRLDIGDKVSLELLNQFLKIAPSLQEINRTDWSCGDFVSNSHSKTPLKLSFQGLIINLDLLGKVLKMIPTVQELDLRSCGYHEIRYQANGTSCGLDGIDLQSLQKLDCSSSSITTTTLGEILAKAPNVQVIGLKVCNNLLGDEFASPIDLALLQKLDCQKSTINSSLLGQLLSKASNIEEIDLSECTNLSGQIPHAIDLRSLRKLNCRGSTITLPLLEQLLRAAPNIQEIGLEGCKRLYGQFRPLVQMPHLQKLNSYGSTMSWAMTLHLLTKAPHLQELTVATFSNPQDLTVSTSFNDLDLRCLQRLVCTESNITLEVLGQILLKAPLIHNLRLRNCDNLTGEFASDLFARLQLNHLQKLDLRDMHLSTPLLGQILLKAPHLRELTLWQCKGQLHLFTSQVADALELSSLENLTCWYVSIPLGLLEQLLQKAPNIEDIKMCACNNLSGSFPNELRSTPILGNLQKFLVSNAAINLKSLGQLFTKMPNVSDLALAGCNELSGELGKNCDHLDLGRVKKLGFNRSNINIKMLGHLLTKMPRVEEIDLHECMNLSGEFAEEHFDAMDLGSLQELYCYDSAITPDLLKQFMTKAPNARVISQFPRSESSFAFLGASGAIPNRSQAIDADTGLSPTQFDVPLVFKGKDGEHPSVCDYRETVYYRLRVKEQLAAGDKPFEWYNDAPPELIACSANIGLAKDLSTFEAIWEQSHAPGSKFYYGIVEAPSGKWVVLPSLSPEETITYMHGKVDIGYSNRDNLYFVKSLEAAPIKFHFIVKVPHHCPHSTFNPSLQKLIEECSEGWGDAPLNIHGQAKSGYDLLTAIFEQKKGACRHRVVAFYHQMQKRHPEVRVRAWFNRLHNFCELNVDGKWLRCDLGGSRADLNVSEANHPNLAQRQLQIVNGTSAPRTIVDYFRTNIIVKSKNSLVEVHSKEELHYVMQIIQDEFAHRAVRVVNLSTLDMQEIKRLLARKNVPKETCIVGLYILNGSFVERTEEFLALFHNKLELLPFRSSASSVDHSQTLSHLVLQTLWNVPAKEAKKIHWDLNHFKEFVEQHALIVGKNVHMALHSQEELDCCSYWLQKHIPNSYYIDQPEEIRCSARWLDKQGVLQRGPGGPLYDYLKSTPRPVILINFNSFKADDIVRCNAIIDTQMREADGVLLAKEACVIALSVIRPNAYTGKDFTDRFYHSVEILPFAATYPVRFATDVVATAAIDLYGASDWKEQLAGRWKILGNRFVWKKGFLQKGHSTLEIQNGPWEDREFRHFWQQRSLLQDFTLVKRTTPIQTTIETIDRPPDTVEPIVLNPTTFEQMVTRYLLEDGALTTLPGLVKHSKGKTLYASITRELTEGQKHRLNRLCQKHQVTLLRVLSPLSPKAKIIVSDNVEPTIKRLKAESNALVFDISESDARLVESMEAEWLDEVTFRFTRRQGALLDALESGEQIILKGRFSGELVDALVPLLLQKSQITLVTDSKKGFELFITGEDRPIDVIPSVAYPEPLHPSENERLDAVLKAINRAPHLSIEGPTGVGKTTFIKEVLAKQPGISLFIGMQEVGAWAECKGKGLSILFIDEANMQKSHFSCFEGLYQEQKGVLDASGRYYPVCDHHRVIFAQNPVSYGGEREAVTFFERHKNSVHFAPFSDAYLRAKVPNEMFIEVYKQAAILSPRELEMMALMAKSSPEKDPKIFACRIARNALPKERQQKFTQWFVGRFGAIPTQPIATHIQDFVLTETRLEAYNLVLDLLAVRRYRQQSGELGGLGGLVLEGSPGDGKSHFAVAVLLAHGFKQVAPHEIGSCRVDAFCRIPANMPVDEKRACFLAAFHAGQVVIPDEMNASPSLEPLHNALLMGFDESGNKAAKAGYLLIGTQNPITLAGRRATSVALKRRLIFCEFSPYTQKESFQIVQKRFPALSEEAIRLVTQKPLSFRELLTLIEKGLQAKTYTLNPLPEVQKQIGQTCKLYALSTVMQWLYKRAPKPDQAPPPPRKHNGQAITSLREQAKRLSYSQIGEVYSPLYLQELARRYGYGSTHIVQADHENYISTLKTHLDQGHAPIIFFDVDMKTGRPIKLTSKQEHAAVAVGYFYDLQSNIHFSLLHWGKPWVVSGKELSDSANNLTLNREPETFYKIDGAWRQIGDLQDTSGNELRAAIQAKKYTKRAIGTKSNDTFRNKLLIVA